MFKLSYNRLFFFQNLPLVFQNFLTKRLSTSIKCFSNSNFSNAIFETRFPVTPQLFLALPKLFSYFAVDVFRLFLKIPVVFVLPNVVSKIFLQPCFVLVDFFICFFSSQHHSTSSKIFLLSASPKIVASQIFVLLSNVQAYL